MTPPLVYVQQDQAQLSRDLRAAQLEIYYIKRDLKQFKTLFNRYINYIAPPQ